MTLTNNLDAVGFNAVLARRDRLRAEFYQVSCGLVNVDVHRGEIAMPTAAQTLKCFQICCDLTSKYCSIDLVTLDNRTGNVVILAKQEINIEIESDGDWRFV